ncbi:MAG TPA: TraR/DksA C4-type zinc finger protein [Solirubrobacteraceae bacterium]|jgi:DnaK suppressor protein
MNAEEARELLTRERERIERAIVDDDKPAGDEEGAVFDNADVAPELVQTDIDEALARSLREELDAVERAERRLAEGTYGFSVDSGAPIDEGRLRSIPWAERTAEEQAALEARGG